MATVSWTSRKLPHQSSAEKQAGDVAVSLVDEQLFSQIALWMSQGSLQMLSMASQRCSDIAYRLAGLNWAEIDMANWPFGAVEVRLERKRRARREERARERPRLLAEWEAWHASNPEFHGLDFGPPHPDEMSDLEMSDFGNEPFVIGLDTILGPGRGLLAPRKDTRVLDEDLLVALRRLAPGTVKRLYASSSLLTASGVCQALRMQCGLLELCLSDCGSGNLGGEDVQAALDACTSLRVLELHGVRACPPVAARRLQELKLGQGVHAAAVVAARRFPDLRLLQFSATANEADLLGIFGACRELRDVRMYGGVQLTDKILAAVVANCHHLSKFIGSRTEPVDLTEEAIRLFKEHFPEADIFVDDVFGEMVDAYD